MRDCHEDLFGFGSGVHNWSRSKAFIDEAIGSWENLAW